MKKILVIFLFLWGSGYCQTDSLYLEGIIQHRKEKDIEFVDSLQSPLKPAQIIVFNGLKYFPPNSDYKVNAKFKKKIGNEFDLSTSSGKLKKYRKYGTLRFKLKGIQYELSVYQSIALLNHPLYKNHLFVPFTDLTNGEGTYGGGRYLDLELFEGKYIELDFNYCYNPYCCYTTGFSCPIPPKENFLNLKIEAGEKDFEEH